MELTKQLIEQERKYAKEKQFVEFLMTIKEEDFKRCVEWNKTFNAWSGTLHLPETGSHSVRGVPGRAVRLAKPEILEQLMLDVARYCFDHEIDLNAALKSALKRKAAKRKNQK